MRTPVILIVITLLVTVKLSAIKPEFGLTKSTGIIAGNQAELFSIDGGIVFGAGIQLKEKIELLPKLELSFVPFGTTVGFRLGPAFKLYQKDKFQLSVYPAIYQGIAMFRPKSLYTWGTSLEGFLSYQTGKKSFLQIGTGIRYISCPAYKQYGTISSFAEIPFTLSYIYQFKNQ